MKLPPFFRPSVSTRQARRRRLKRALSQVSRLVPASMLGALPFVTHTSSAWAQNAAPVHSEPEIVWWQGLILGLVQGLTEFIPVSSSGHLNITHYFMGHPRELTFDVLLHIGTLAALGFYFRHDWKGLLLDKSQAKMRNLVFLACVPAAVAGALLRNVQDLPLFADVRFNAAMLIVAGAILWVVDRTSRQEREMKSITLKDALLIGASQAVALIPGVSRSGSTLTMGLLLGLKRSDAARFSFLMSLPITLGALVFESYSKFIKDGQTINASLLTIVLSVGISAVSGFWAISFLLNYLKTKDVTPFFVWRVAVALTVFALIFSGFSPR